MLDRGACCEQPCRQPCCLINARFDDVFLWHKTVFPPSHFYRRIGTQKWECVSNQQRSSRAHPSMRLGLGPTGRLTAYLAAISQGSLPTWACQGAKARVLEAPCQTSKSRPLTTFCSSLRSNDALLAQGCVLWDRSVSSSAAPPPPPLCTAKAAPRSSTAEPWRQPGRRSWHMMCAKCWPRPAGPLGSASCWWAHAQTACCMCRASRRRVSG